ncbi:hypothetical protein K2173_002945 [Erythroxylum novogranatense]|uniref:Homeobox domain-containing protein n=1 Tax=Erythroxylum novogranatense TaxID=1862640 RepID=A0AAV8TU37_9ROSI|nr:hypothetical protein K2173_002945 [Erythroxylum novogranatense]
MDIQGDMGLLGDPFDPSLAGRDKDDGFESRSGSDNLEGVSGDEQEAGDDQRRRKKKYHRHTQHQIQELEAFFKECLHPDEKQRSELSRRLCLENKQIKFWFQNRRTQMKRAWSKPVLDRVGLIIEIFNAHAHTKEAKVQAELAALMYKKSRLVRVRGPKGCNTFGATGLGEAEVVSARG